MKFSKCERVSHALIVNFFCFHLFFAEPVPSLLLASENSRYFVYCYLSDAVTIDGDHVLDVDDQVIESGFAWAVFQSSYFSRDGVEVVIGVAQT